MAKIQDEELAELAALARQQYAELVRLVPQERFRGPDELSTEARDRACRLAVDILGEIAVARQAAGDHILESGGIITSRHLRFFSDSLFPLADDLKSLVYELIDRGSSEIDFAGDLPAAHPSKVATYLNFALHRCEGMWEFWDNEFNESVHDSAVRLVNSHFFQPEGWLERHGDLLPASLEGAQRVPYHVRLRLDEIYRSYIFGNWMSVIALSRSLLEYALLNCASRLQIDASEVRGIRSLVEAAGVRLPELVGEMDQIVTLANDIIHPKRGDKLITMESAIGSLAKGCTTSVRLVIERLYS